jgi:hypothetical protein
MIPARSFERREKYYVPERLLLIQNGSILFVRYDNIFLFLYMGVFIFHMVPTDPTVSWKRFAQNDLSSELSATN